MEYHKQYKHINKKVILAVRRTIKNGVFKVNPSIRIMFLDNLKNNLCNIYGIPEDKKPSLICNDCLTGFYNPVINCIGLRNDKLSLVTFLHEFKHFLQHHNGKKNSEKIARGYSLSLYYKATPKLFKRAVEKGLIIHQKP